MSAGQRNRKEDFYQPQFTRHLADHHLVESNVGMFPLYLYPDTQAVPLLKRNGDEARANLSDQARAYVSHLGVAEADLFHHVVAILHAPAYRTENAGALRQDWPRVPLPSSKHALRTSAGLGRQLAALLDPETPVPGVTSGSIRPELRRIGLVAATSGGHLDPDAGDLKLTAGWGHAGKGGVTMPGKGKLVQRACAPDETAAIAAGAKGLGLPAEQVQALLGDRTCDVYLNGVAYWRNVPSKVWTYTLGGYQVIKKWLSYREHEILGRSLTSEEAREVTNIARRIAAILLLEPALDANYEAVKRSPYAWPSQGG